MQQERWFQKTLSNTHTHKQSVKTFMFSIHSSTSNIINSSRPHQLQTVCFVHPILPPLTKSLSWGFAGQMKSRCPILDFWLKACFTHTYCYQTTSNPPDVSIYHYTDTTHSFNIIKLHNCREHLIILNECVVFVQCCGHIKLTLI